MPRWSRDRAALGARYPDERWSGACPCESAPLLRRWDHHVVRVAGRPALLLTYAWDLEPPDARPASEPLPFEVSFTYPRGHPPAPPEVQAVVDRIAFTPSGAAASDGMSGTRRSDPPAPGGGSGTAAHPRGPRSGG